MMAQEKILFLSPQDSPLCDWLKEQGESVTRKREKITPEYVEEHEFTFIISYGYWYILEKAIVDKFRNRAINLHISYLPWNRGVDPNFWSFVDGTSKGVTIHYLDHGIDTGDIIVQEAVNFDAEDETLATSYDKLQRAVQGLFKRHWNEIKNGSCLRQKQSGKGSSYRERDKEPLSHLLTAGWDTPVCVLEEYGAELQMFMQFWKIYDAEIEEIRKQNKA